MKRWMLDSIHYKIVYILYDRDKIYLNPITNSVLFLTQTTLQNYGKISESNNSVCIVIIPFSLRTHL